MEPKDIIQLSDHFTYRRLLRFCIPSIIMMIFTSIYGVVDGFFISNFAGKDAFAGVNLIMPVLMIMGSLGMMFGTGGTALVSKILGQGDRDRANRVFSMIIEFDLVFGIVIGIVGFIFTKDIVLALGATENIVDYAVIYGQIGTALIFIFTLQMMFQSLMGAAEKPKLSLFFTVGAGVTNMVLDALFVGIFHWGVAGAAAATSTSEAVGGIIPLIYFIFPNSTPFRFRPVIPDFRAIAQAAFNGVSELMSNISGSIVSIAFNFQLLKYAGSDGVAAYGVVMYVMFIFIAALIGLTFGTTPIIGYHFGAGNRHEINNVMKKALSLEFFGGIAMFLAAELLAGTMARIFVGYDADLCEMTTSAFRIYSVFFAVAGVNIFMSSFFTALNNGLISAAISFCRGLVFELIALFTLPLLLELTGIWWAPAVAEAGSLIISIGCLLHFDRRYGYLHPDA